MVLEVAGSNPVSHPIFFRRVAGFASRSAFTQAGSTQGVSACLRTVASAAGLLLARELRRRLDLGQLERAQESQQGALSRS